ncbi:unnamed protein product [Penicillium salamii]|uniref:NACHT domain-containing protein n=1 Tax=Penicillium salamii TaxID=1612424 RepID=A0A9W4J6Z2_9EURO|nr:unnamed protein product [Penicillium salamii]
MSGNVDVSFGPNHSGVQLGINNGNVNIQSHNVDILDKLLVARGAELDSYSDQHEDECLHGTRTDLLRNVAEWATSPGGKCIFWLNGMAGTGKSTIARTVARFFPGEQFTAATFFFKRGEADRGNATRLFPTISRQLATKIPDLASNLRNALTNDPDLGKKSLKVQFQGLLLRPLLDLDRLNSQMRMMFIIIDALDECDTDDDIRVILQLLPQLQELSTVRLRIFLTSRPELPIRLGFSKMANHQYQDLALHEIPEEVTAHDISLFLRDRFRKIQDKKDVPTDWPGEDAIQTLVEMSVPLFISAATVCRHVGCKLDPVKELADLIKDQAKYSTKMDKTYLPVLVRLLGGQDEEDKDLTLQYFRQIVGSIILFANPLPVNALSRFLELEERLISNLLDSFRSVLRLPSGRDQPVQILHQSFRDFLLQTKSQFYIDKGQTHKNIALHCLHTMRAKLKRDICNLNHHGTRRMKIDKRLIHHHLQPELQYSCRYWVRHLEQCVDQSDIAQEALLFLQQHFLHWVEAMSTLGLASDVVMMISSLQIITHEVPGSTLSDFLHDANRFVLKFQQIANVVPLQFYCAGLMFTPVTSIIRRQFINELPPWICQLPEVSQQWSAELQTLEGHPSMVHAVAFSPDSRFLASCSGSWGSDSEDNIIQLWDAATGALRQTLKGHSDAVISLAFSPKGWLLASGSHDQSVRLWNPITGALVHTLGSHPMGVDALAFSPCGRLIASGSAVRRAKEDGTIRLWDTATGTLRKELEGNSGGVNSLIFSPNGRLLVSGSGCLLFGRQEDHIVRIWNISTGKLQHTLGGHSGKVNCVAFSSDGHLFASGSEDSNVRIWDSATGVLRQTLKAHDTVGVKSLAFSPNGRLLASSSFSPGHDEDDEVVRLWDPAAGTLLQILQGHSGGITSLAFSPNGRQLASGSEDSTVRMWDPVTNLLHPTPRGHREWVSTLVVSPDGNLLASGSNDETIRLWNSVTGALNHILEGHSEAISDIAFSPDSRLLASGSCDNTVRLWDSATGELRHVLVGQKHWVRISFSPDGFLLASRSVESPIRIWDPMTGALKQTLEYNSSEVHPIAFSPDTKLLASGSDRLGPDRDSEYWIILWDLATGEERQTLKGHLALVSSVAFSPDGHLLASSSSGDNTVRLWDPASGLLLQTFEAQAFSLAFSPDSQILAFSSPRWTMQLLNLATGSLKQSPALCQEPGDVTFSQDGSSLSTHAGVFHVESQCDKSMLNSPQPGFELYIDREYWICIDNERVLWLPVELRPTSCVVFDGKIAFGNHSGMVSVMGFCANR